MQIVKALVGGLIGGGSGALLSSQIQSMADLSSPWFLLLIGLGTGIGARIATGSSRSFATGVTGAVTAILVIFASSYMEAMADVKGSPETNAAPVAVVDMGDVALDDPTESGEDVADPGEDVADTGDAADTAGEAEADVEAETGEDAETGDEAENADGENANSTPADSSSGTGPATTSHAPAAATTPISPVRSQFDWTPMEFLINAGSALLAFALSGGSGAAAGGAGRRGSSDRDADA